MEILALLACVLIGAAAYNLTCAFSNIPSAKTSKMMMTAKKQQGVKREKMFDVYTTRIAACLEKSIRIDKLKRAKLQSVLALAGMEMSPEVYTLRAYIKAAAVALCSLPVFMIQPLLAMVVIGLAVTLWFSNYYSAFDIMKKRRKIIEAEIPRFALTITQNIENGRDVLKILNSYRQVAGKEFKHELDKTIADMKTGNYENALIRFESRVGSPLLSDVLRGLTGTIRGEDQRMYFKMICFDMRQIEQNSLKKEVSKRPKKIQKYSMMMLICIVIIYLVVLVTEVLGSLGSFFG